MKLSKVHFKIFVYFVVLLIITEIAIFGFFILFVGRKYGDYMEEYNETRFKMAREMVEYQLSKTTLATEINRRVFSEYVRHIGVALKTNIWLTDQSGEVIAQSFEGEIPWEKVEDYLETVQEWKKEEANRPFYSSYKRFHPYRTISIQLPDQRQSTFHMIFDRKPNFSHGTEFAIGLVGIGVIIALLTIPLARMMTRPVKSLTASTKKLEEGDLSHRTEIKSRDEIGELATSFNKMAEKLERMMISSKELTAQVSHELRSPLARIQIAVEIMKDRLNETKDSNLREHLQEIRVDVEELDRLIGRILDLSKLDMREDVPYTEVFSPIQLLKNSLERYHVSLKTKKIRLVLNFENEAKIMGNRDGFLTIITNLLDNSVRYSPVNGNIYVDSDTKDGELVLTIANSCGTIPEDELNRIFEPFYRLNHLEENGGGLGLAISKRIVEKHKGKIKALSTERGLEFVISIPTIRID